MESTTNMTERAGKISPRFVIIFDKTGDLASKATYASAKQARRQRDRLDLAYGACRYSIKEVL